jgi:hypothetical protein
VTEPGVHFIDGGNTSYHDALEVSLVGFEQNLEDNRRWGEGPVTLGIVSVSTLAGVGAIQFELLDGDVIPAGLVANPVHGFSTMVNLIVRDVRNDDPNVAHFTDELTNGFLGWVYVVEGTEVDNQGGPSVRMMAYYNMGNGAFFVLRREQGGEPDYGWGVPDNFHEDGNLVYGTLKRLVQVSHYLIIRGELFAD